MNRSSEIIRTSIVGIVTNVLLASFKALVGIIAGSIAIVMDAINNLSDALSSVITIIGTKLSQKPADRKHPFGYGRVEYFSAIIIAVIVISAGVTSLIESVKKIIEPTEPNYTTVTLIVVSVAIIAKLLLGWYVKSQGKKLRSDALIASGSDALFDAIITLATLISAGVMLIWGISLDGILGTIISALIIKAGIEMLASILHNYGPEVMIGTVHISVDDTLTAQDIHGLSRKITLEMVQNHGIIMTVGVYAVATGDNQRKELQTLVLKTLQAHKELVQIHGFYYSEKENLVTVDVVPDLTVKDDNALCEALTKELMEKIPGRTIMITVDHNYSE